MDGLAAAAARYERPSHLGPLHISVTPRMALDQESVESFQAMGVNRLIPMNPPRFTADEVVAMVDDIGARFIARV